MGICVFLLFRSTGHLCAILGGTLLSVPENIIDKITGRDKNLIYGKSGGR